MSVSYKRVTMREEIFTHGCVGLILNTYIVVRNVKYLPGVICHMIMCISMKLKLAKN